MQYPNHDVIRQILEAGDVGPSTRQYFLKYVLKAGVIFRKTEKADEWVVSIGVIVLIVT